MSFASDPADFKKNFQAGKTQILWKRIPADLETPVSTFIKLAGEKPYSLLLESVEGGAVLGRYSAIGLDPDVLWECRKDTVTVTVDGKKSQDKRPALESLRAHVKESRIDVVGADIPPMGPSGLFGFMGYDMIRLIERIPDKNPDALNLPESLLMRPTLMVIFDNIKHELWLITPVRVHADNSKCTPEVVYSKAVTKLEDAVAQFLNPLPASALGGESALKAPLPVSSNMKREDFHAIVKQSIEYIRAGEIFQVVPSQRFDVPFDLPALDLYRSLRRLNPSPFMFFINFGGFTLVGSSPEILVRVRGGDVTIRPIAGTRKRGATAEEDRALASDLLADPKERAEHLMLLDLGRNDVGRVAKIGSVKVTEQFTIEYYSHVMHIVSNVTGKLRDDLDSLDALFAGFPAGTVSGAPKIRAMEIIDELEPQRRSFYAGCVGYLDGNGDLDTCITLRTALIKDGTMYVQAGGGVVADSDPEFEYQESRNKAKALIAAAEQAVAQAQPKQPAAQAAQQRR